MRGRKLRTNILKFSLSNRCASAAMVSKTSDDLPEPDTPVKIIIFRLGIFKVTSLRLFSRAPRISIYSCIITPYTDILFSGSVMHDDIVRVKGLNAQKLETMLLRKSTYLRFDSLRLQYSITAFSPVFTLTIIAKLAKYRWIQGQLYAYGRRTPIHGYMERRGEKLLLFLRYRL